MNLGLVMGGGGLVGIAWELGVLAGLQEAAGLDPTSAAVIVGSSAGSVSGAQAALGRDLGDLVDRQRRTGSGANERTAAGAAGSGTSPDSDGAGAADRARSVPQEVLKALMSSTGSIEERAAKIGKMAMEADVPVAEAAYVESFRSFLGTEEWPAVDLRVTTAEAETGRSVLWSRHDGIDLIRAVASSCAIPCFFPPVSFRGKHYVDGPRAGYMARLAKEKALDGILFVGPNAAMPPQLARQVELEELAERGHAGDHGHRWRTDGQDRHGPHEPRTARPGRRGGAGRWARSGDASASSTRLEAGDVMKSRLEYNRLTTGPVL